MHRKALLVLSITTFLVAFGGGVGARWDWGGDLPQPTQPEVESADEMLAEPEVVSPEVALNTDAAAIAAEQAISVEAALDRLQFQEDVDQFVGSLPTSLLDEVYAAGEMIWGDSPSAILRFKGEVPEVVSAALRESGLEGVTLQGGMAYSYLELQRFSQAAHRATVGLGFTSVVSGFDPRTGIVEIDVVLQASRPQLTGARLVEAVLAATPAADVPEAGAPVLSIREFPADSRPLVELHHTHGGTSLKDDACRAV